MSLFSSSYDYYLPQELIASYPKEDRTSSRLLIYDRGSDSVTHTTFDKILSHIPKDTSIIFNDTKVIKARIFGQKSTGGRVELLLNSAVSDKYFSVFIRGKVREGTILSFEAGLEAVVVKLLSDGMRVVKFSRDCQVLDFLELIEILNSIGQIPLPSYIKREDNELDSRYYQTVFAKNYGSVASPTASLHFSEELFEDIKREFDIGFVTLNVGAGTFKPVEVENIEKHTMHSESYTVSQESRDIILSDKKLLAVGTTATRTVETFVRTGELSGQSQLFLHPENRPQRVDYLITNFHLPKSTLIMLVSSFIGLEKTKELYREAIEREYKFFSYGDAMMIL
jgi:S-adenosylmethionine:tRNA ribosyltransferase-isomerase